jgi:broad specificity phosphatase PhoE
MFVSGLEDLKSKTKKSGNKYFVMRHGEAESNELHILSTTLSNSHHLTEKGKMHVVESAKILQNENIDVIITSPFLRTKETAEITDV